MALRHPTAESLVLSKLAYLTLCRSIQLLTQLARGDAAKDLEILEHEAADAGDLRDHNLTVVC